MTRVHLHLPELTLYQCHHLIGKAAYQVATLVKRKSWKAMMESGRDPSEGIFLSLGLIVRCVVACDSIATRYIHHPQPGGS